MLEISGAVFRQDSQIPGRIFGLFVFEGMDKSPNRTLKQAGGPTHSVFGLKVQAMRAGSSGLDRPENRVSAGITSRRTRIDHPSAATGAEMPEISRFDHPPARDATPGKKYIEKPVQPSADTRSYPKT